MQRNNLRKLKSLSLTLDGGLSESRKLRKIACELNDGCDELNALGSDAQSVHQRVLNCVLLQGKRLCEAKTIMGHGHFMAWVSRHIPRISHRTATRWMQAATWAEGKLDILSNLRSVAELYLLADILPAPEQPELRTEPAFSLAVVMRWAKPIQRIAGIDMDAVLSWSAQERAELVRALEPAAAAFERLKATVPDWQAQGIGCPGSVVMDAIAAPNSAHGTPGKESIDP